MRRYLPSILLAAFVFSPRLVGPVRLGDILALPVMAWCIPALLDRRARRLTAVESAFLALLAVVSATTIIALATGLDGRGESAMLGIARLLELAVLYFVSARCGEALPPLRRTAAIAIGLLFLLAVVEYVRMRFLAVSEYDRVFNAGWFAGEANHAAGSIAVLSALAPAVAIPGLAAILLAGSRSAFAASVIAQARLLINARRLRELLLFALVAAALLVIAPAGTLSRWADLLEPHRAYNGPHVDRIEAWSVVLDETPPLLGAGFGSRPSAVYESCFAMMYAESGVIGLAAFIALLAAMILAREETIGAIAPTLGVALAVFSLTANALLIARVAAPAAIILGASRRRR